MKPAPQAWHYTYGPRWDLIRASSVILPSTSFLFAPDKPAVWFSVNQRWEPTSRPAVKNPDGSARNDITFDWLAREIGCIRIGLRSEGSGLLRHYRHFQQVIHPLTALLENGARNAGADPNHWFFSLEPVPARLWDKVERFQNGHWRPIENTAPWPGSQPIKIFDR